MKKHLALAALCFSIYTMLRFDILIAIYFIILAIYLKPKDE